MSLVVRSTVLGHRSTFDLAGRMLEEVSLHSDDLAKRVVRLTTSAGEVGFRFGGSQRLSAGDIIYADDRLVVAVQVAADDVLIFRPPTIEAAAGIGHALGNRHLPIQLDADTIVVRYDSLLEALAAEHGVPVVRETRTMAAPFRHPYAPHVHE